MTRSQHWRKAGPPIQEWVLQRFAASGRSVWEYIDYHVTLEQVGINRANFMKELAPLIPETKRDSWDEGQWWNRVSGRIYYLFHKAGDKADRSKGERRPRGWGEWSGPRPPRPEEAACSEAEMSNQSAMYMEGRRPIPFPLQKKWDQWRSHIVRIAERFRVPPSRD